MNDIKNILDIKLKNNDTNIVDKILNYLQPCRNCDKPYTNEDLIGDYKCKDGIMVLLCDDCDDLDTCGTCKYCDTFFKEDEEIEDNHLNQCSNCGDKECFDCGLNYCDDCDTPFCNDCSGLKWCYTCDEKFCNSCRDSIREGEVITYDYCENCVDM